jgi:hypothetical protein
MPHCAAPGRVVGADHDPRRHHPNRQEHHRKDGVDPVMRHGWQVAAGRGSEWRELLFLSASDASVLYFKSTRGNVTGRLAALDRRAGIEHVIAQPVLHALKLV